VKVSCGCMLMEDYYFFEREGESHDNLLLSDPHFHHVGHGGKPLGHDTNPIIIPFSFFQVFSFISFHD